VDAGGAEVEVEAAAQRGTTEQQTYCV
jgi:hypothetical protein